MIVFYHNADMDGICSAAILHQRYPDAELFGINYGDKFPWDKVQDEEVWMVDFSLQPFGDMVRLQREAKSLVWIDHHASAIGARDDWLVVDEGNPTFQGVQKSGIGACALVWLYLFHDHPELPEPVRLLAEYDVWNHKNEKTLPFQYGIRLFDGFRDPDSPEWREMLDREEGEEMWVEDCVRDGYAVIKYLETDNAEKARTLCFEHLLPVNIKEVDGDGGLVDGYWLKCIAANFGPTNSKFFDSVLDPEKHEAMLLYSWRKTHWVISLYSDREDVDVSEVAKAYGGGGHKGAAGFQVQSLKEIGL
jgi:oligoribonuclease NrnB/cAMP/cGMP phosphodiesterase (DHH superfamily)